MLAVSRNRPLHLSAPPAKRVATLGPALPRRIGSPAIVRSATVCHVALTNQLKVLLQFVRHRDRRNEHVPRNRTPDPDLAQLRQRRCRVARHARAGRQRATGQHQDGRRSGQPGHRGSQGTAARPHRGLALQSTGRLARWHLWPALCRIRQQARTGVSHQHQHRQRAVGSGGCRPCRWRLRGRLADSDRPPDRHPRPALRR